MKTKSIIAVIMILLMFVTTIASAFSLDFEEERADQLQDYPCINKNLFQNEIYQVGLNPYFNKGISTFKDGHHVIHFKEDKFNGVEYITIYKELGKIKWLGLGICSTEYEEYAIGFKVAEIEDAFESDDGEKKFSIVMKVITSVEGVSFGQKIHIVKTSIQYLINRYL